MIVDIQIAYNVMDLKAEGKHVGTSDTSSGYYRSGASKGTGGSPKEHSPPSSSNPRSATVLHFFG